MLTAHPHIAAVRAACDACAYPSAPASSRPTPPSVRFAATAVGAYNTAAALFIAGTFTQCNAAAVASEAAANAYVGGDMLAAHAGICATRTACIAAGNSPASEPPVDHPGAPHTCLHCSDNKTASRASVLLAISPWKWVVLKLYPLLTCI